MLKRMMSLVMVLSLVATMTITASAADGDEIVILYSNDTHCHLEEGVGIAGFAGYADEMKAVYGEDYVTLVDVGDFVQGDVVGALSEGGFIIDAYNAAGYDIVTLGNHEFDYEIPRMFELMDELDATVVSSNFVEVATGETVYDPYTMVTYGDVSVAYVGITTPETYIQSSPTYYMDDEGNLVYSFCQSDDGQALYDAVQSAIDGAKAEGADYIIALAHLGTDETSAPWRSTDVIANTTGLDAVIDGHTYDFAVGDIYLDAEGNEVILTNMGGYYANIGKMTIDTLTGEITCQAIGPDDITTYNEDVLAVLAEINAQLDPMLDEVVAYTEVPLVALDGEIDGWSIRRMETNLGDLVADAYRTLLGTDVAMVNGGGIRADISAGEITFREIIAVNPYGNSGAAVYATGQEILDALEVGAQNYPEEYNGFLQTSGLTYSIDTSIVSSVVTDDMGAFVAVTGDYRICDVMVNGESIDLSATYTVASHDYLLFSGGDYISMFMDNEEVKTIDMMDYQILIDYITEYLDGQVGEDYADINGQGRMSVLAETETEVEPEVEPEVEVEVVPEVEVEVEVVPSVEAETTEEGSATYTVVAGDCLWNIAARMLGTGTRWGEIAVLNPSITDVASIQIGQVLLLPMA